MLVVSFELLQILYELTHTIQVLCNTFDLKSKTKDVFLYLVGLAYFKLILSCTDAHAIVVPTFF